MDQVQDRLDPEIAQELISLLNRKITNLRNENAELQSQLSKDALKAEGGSNGSQNDGTQRLLQEIDHWKSELERRPDPGEVAELEEKLKRSKQRWQESEQTLRSQVEQLRAELEETQLAMQSERALKEALEKEVELLYRGLNQIAREKEEALAHIESLPPDKFDVRQFLNGVLEALPPLLDPIIVAVEGSPRFKGVAMKRTSNNKFMLAVSGNNVIKWANEGGGCVVPFPPVVYRGKKLAAEKNRENF